MRFAGEKGTCWPSWETLASELRVSEKTVRGEYAKALVRAGLIRWKTRVGRRSNTFEFLWHESFNTEFERTTGTAQLDGSSGVPPADEREKWPDLSAPQGATNSVQSFEFSTTELNFTRRTRQPDVRIARRHSKYPGDGAGGVCGIAV